jgi:RHS repeat-associated protein
VRRVISNGTVSADYQFDPYGNRATVGGSGPDSDFGFAGYFYHAPTGLQFAQHRVYDAQLGRWLTWDPIEAGHSDLASIWTPPARQLAGSLSSRSQIPAAGSPHFNATDLNLYAYARNNPISKRDPSGYCVEDACVVEAAVIGSAISVVGPELPEIEEEGAQVLTTVEEFAAEGWQFHHIFPVQLADWFEDLFDIDVDDWTIFIPRELHALMHAEGWNPAWETWLIEAEENEYSVLDAGQFAIKLLTRYGLWDPCTASRAIVPYPYK